MTAVRSAFMFLTHSLRPMTVEELAEAVLIDTENQSFNPGERSSDALSVVLGLYSRLVTITTASESEVQSVFNPRHPQRMDFSAMRIVKFSHNSVKEYMISSRPKLGILHQFLFSELEAHHYISEALLLYLITIASISPSSHLSIGYAGDILRTYAATMWTKHYEQVVQDQRRESLIQMVRDLFDTGYNPKPYIYWLSMSSQDFDPSRSSFYGGNILSDFPPPIYLASFLGDLVTWQWLIEKGLRIDDHSGNCKLGDTLQAATLGNHVEIVRGLLGQGAPVNTDHGYFGDPLQAAAAFGGGLETVELLLERGTVLNTDHGEYGNVLIASSHGGHVHIAKLLIDNGADTQLSSRKHGKAIAGAAASGKSELINILLGTGNDINHANGSQGTALYCAAKSGDLRVVQMLVKAGANVNLRSGELHTPLQVACNEGHVDIVKFLLSKGADTEIFGGTLDSALRACIDCGDLEIMELLLAAGADMNHEGGLYKSPLHCATFRGKAGTAEILLDRGAVFNDTIFLMAVEYEHATLVEKILIKGVNANA
jgi:ankyrin repeat protein